MSERSFRDRLAQIADMIDLEQLDGLVIRRDSGSMDEDQPRLQRLFMGLDQERERVTPPNHAPQPMREEDIPDVLFAPIPDFWSIMGAHRTPLNRAIKEGKYELAEKLITSTSNPENLNDGSMTHALSTGKGLYRTRPRNFRIVRLLLEKGASPNFRSPNVLDLPSGAVTPFEVAICYYLTLLRYQSSTNQSFRFNETDLLNTIGLSGEDWLDLSALITQAKDLVKLFIEHGADVNLQTTNSGRTIFHEVIANEISDHDLIERMVTLGALVNLTDVHGTTPFMDLIKNTEVAVKVYDDLNHHQKRVLIDAQNCCGETSLWRSMFNGRMDCSRLLIDENANTALSARIQESPADSFIGSYGFRPFGFNAQLLKKRSIIKTLPALFAPLLFDSPCISTEREKFGELNETLRVSMLDKFSVKVFNKVVEKYMSPLIDSCDPGFCNEEMSIILVNLIKNHTDYRHLIDDKIFQPTSLVQLMFGNLTSGLRQLAVRQILNSALFEKPLEELASTLESLKSIIFPGSPCKSNTKLKTKSKSQKEWQDQTTGDSALTASSLSDTVAQDDSEIPTVLAFSEPELRSSTPVMSFGENWYMRQPPQYNNGGPRRVFNSLEGYELEISQDSGRSTVTRLQRMLQETNDRLERLQSEVQQVSHRSDDEDEENSDEEPPLSLWRPKTPEDSDDEDENRFKVLPFELSPRGKITPKLRVKGRPDPRFDDSAIRLLSPKAIEKLTHSLGLPPGLKPFMELEAARLQLGAAFFHHSTIKCDRGCEGNDEESDITSDDEDDEDSWDESLSQPTSGHDYHTTSEDSDDDDGDDEDDEPPELEAAAFVPSVPQRPRILSSSSSSSDSMPELADDLPRLRISVIPNASGEAAAAIERDESPPRDFFSFGYNDEHNTIMRYVQQIVTGTFDHSTDSETDDDHSHQEEMPPLE